MAEPRAPTSRPDPHALWQKECPYCRAAISSQELIRPGHCGSVACTQQHILQGARREEKRREEEDAVRLENAIKCAERSLKSVTEVLGCNRDDLRVAVVPYQNEPLVPLPEPRRQGFIAHLEVIVTEAFALEQDEIELPNFVLNEAPEHPIVSAACTTCQGFCCKQGAKKNAFLKGQNIRYLRLQDPCQTQDDVVATYANALPELSSRNSCVYQGRDGCMLPRELRSDVCNTFHCRDLHVMYHVTEGHSDLPIAIVALDDMTPRAVTGFRAETGRRQIQISCDELET